MVERLRKYIPLLAKVRAIKSNTEQEVNVLGVHNTAKSWINSQSEPGPVGTFINVNSGLAGYLMPGNSAYGSSKIAVHRYMEFLDLGELSLSNTANAANGLTDFFQNIQHCERSPCSQALSLLTCQTTMRSHRSPKMKAS